MKMFFNMVLFFIAMVETMGVIGSAFVYKSIGMYSEYNWGFNALIAISGVALLAIVVKELSIKKIDTRFKINMGVVMGQIVVLALLILSYTSNIADAVG